MLKYLFLQIKRTKRLLFPVILCTLLLFGILWVAYTGIMGSAISEESQSKLNIALCGDVDHPLIQMGVTALKAVDNTRFSMNFHIMDENQAVSALEAVEIDAYVAIPEGFMQEALKGELQKLKFVSTAGAVGMGALFKDEITRAVSTIVSACQTGMLAFDSISKEYSVIAQEDIAFSPLAITYVEYVLIRGNAYEVEDLGITDPLGLEGYLVSGIFVLLMGLLLVPFGVLFIKKDRSLERLLQTKGIQSHHQVLSECLSCVFVLMLIIGTCVCSVPLLEKMNVFSVKQLFPQLKLSGIWMLSAVAVLIGTFLHLMFTISENLVSGLLLSFFAHIGLGFISGCLYPMYFFPESLQKVAVYLPHSFGRLVIADILTGECVLGHLLPTVLYSFCFAGLDILLRIRRIKGGRGSGT